MPEPFEIQIVPTDKITIIAGAKCRVWKGVTADGIECHVFVHRIAVRETEDTDAFEGHLSRMPVPHEVPLTEILH